MGSKGGSVTVGYRYSMTLQMGLCRGAVDEIVQIEAGGLNAWPFAVSKTETEALDKYVFRVTSTVAQFYLSLDPTPGAAIETLSVVNGQEVQFEVTAPSGMTVLTTYYVVNVQTLIVSGTRPTRVYFELAATPGGTPIATPFTTSSFKVTVSGGGVNGANVLTIARGPNGTGVAQFLDGTSESRPGSDIVTASVSSRYRINAPELFGGDKKEGGLDGTLDVYLGGSNQTYSGWFKALVGGLVPDFRGIVSMVFDGLVTSLNPYPKPWKVRVRRVFSGWDGEVWEPALAVIWLRDNTIKAMNPAHIIYECLTNRSWGRGFSRSRIHEPSFLATAQTLFNENFGLCLRYNRQTEIEEFIKEVIDHMGGYLRIDRDTGQIALGLLRGDYDPASLPLFTYNSGLISVEEDETASQDDLVNEVIVKFMDPITNKEKAGRVQNLASVQDSEGKNSTQRVYSGLPTSDLALRVAQRDLKVNATALKRYTVILDRRAWRIQPGSVFRIQAPDLGITNVVLRAGKVREGRWGDGRITVQAVLDVFGMPATSFASVQQPTWSEPNRNPEPATRRLLREATYHDLVRNLSPADLAAVDPTSGTIAVAAGRPTPLSQGYTVSSKTSAEPSFEDQSPGNFVPTAILQSSVAAHQTTIAIVDGVNLNEVEINGQAQVGDEIMQVTSLVVNPDGVSGTMTVNRGVVDTIPQNHASGMAVLFIADDASSDVREYAQSEVVQVKLRPFTSVTTLSLGSAPTDSLSISARHNRPWLPGNMRINGARFNETGTVTTNMVLTWAHRNRLVVRDQFVAHGDPSTSLEPGVQYEIRVFNGTGATTPLRTVTVASDTWTYTTAMMAADGIGSQVVFEVRSVRSGVFSQFFYRFTVNR